MSDALNHLINGELEMFKKAIEANLYSKVGETLFQRKKEIAADMFTEEECSSCGDNLEEKKDFAALAPPYDKPTYADKIAGAKLSAKKNKGKI
jgi:hypothetical protein